MMARVIDAKYSTLVGTPQRIRELITLLAEGAAVVDLKFANLVVLAKEPDSQAIRDALATTPRKHK